MKWASASALGPAEHRAGVSVFLSRLLATLLAALPMAGLAAPEIPAPVFSAPAASAAPEGPPEGLARTDWQGIRAAHEGWRHRFQQEEDGGFSARNPGQQWDTAFDGRGFLARPDHGAWEWGLELRGYGIGKKRVAVTNRAEGVSENAIGASRLVFRRDPRLQEWFHNDTRGLEQGWTLSERPAGAEDEKLILDLAVRGSLRPEVNGSDRSVSFVDDAGTVALTYGGLKAWDAEGRILEARFLPGGAPADDVASGLRIEIDERGAVYPVTIDPIAQQAYLKASNTSEDDQFGRSVSASGDTVVVGAIFEDSAATGVEGNGNDNSTVNAGAAYVFIRSGGIWSQQAYLKASNTGAVDLFGCSVAVDGDTVVVGAQAEDSNATGVNGDENDNSTNQAGAAYVFERSGTTWNQQAYLKASNTGENDQFGVSVSVSGNTVVVGAFKESSADTGVNGDESDDSAGGAGAAYVFTRSGGTWSQQAYLKASNTDGSDLFGRPVSVSGDTVVIGAQAEDSAATGVDGDESDGSASGAGAAYVFERVGITWSQQSYLKASNTGAGDEFGISLSVDGDTVVVGASGEFSAAIGVDGDGSDNSAFNAGAAYVFERSGGNWSQQAYLKASNTGASDSFGCSVAVSGDTVVVGALGEASTATGVDGDESDDSAGSAGAAYVFARSGGTWSQQAYIKASNTGAGDQFGFTVSVSGDSVVVGAVLEDSAITGVNGNGSDNSTNSSGATYLFQISTIGDTPDTTRPRIRFFKKSRLKTPRARHKIKGIASDNEAVANLEVKSRLAKGWRKAKLKPGGQWIYRTPRLDPGRNAFKVRAADTTGNLSRTQRVKATGR